MGYRDFRVVLWMASSLLQNLLYDEKQQKRIQGTHWQDNILAIFVIVVGGALDKANYLRSDTLGGPVVYLLPVVTLWFSLETKLLTHLWVGTPFHPSWWMYGSTKDDQVPRYSKNDWINVTFSIGTILITAVLTSYAWFATNKAVGFDAMGFTSSNTWKFAGMSYSINFNSNMNSSMNGHLNFGRLFFP